jgi:hypothetical protein
VSLDTIPTNSYRPVLSGSEPETFHEIKNPSTIDILSTEEQFELELLDPPVDAVTHALANEDILQAILAHLWDLQVLRSIYTP